MVSSCWKPNYTPWGLKPSCLPNLPAVLRGLVSWVVCSCYENRSPGPCSRALSSCTSSTTVQFFYNTWSTHSLLLPLFISFTTLDPRIPFLTVSVRCTPAMHVLYLHTLYAIMPSLIQCLEYIIYNIWVLCKGWGDVDIVLWIFCDSVLRQKRSFNILPDLYSTDCYQSDDKLSDITRHILWLYLCINVLPQNRAKDLVEW